ncbi:unnamed protein product, partial [Phaeothamnion confervicola]
LADQINIDSNGLPNYLALAIANTVVVVDRAAIPSRPMISFRVALAAGGAGSTVAIDRDGSTSAAITLGGTPVAGELWLVALNGVEYGFTVRQPLTDVAIGLTNALNALPGAYTAQVSGSSITINTTGSPFVATITRTGASQTLQATSGTTLQATVALAGTPIEGETWTLSLSRAGAQTVSVNFTV